MEKINEIKDLFNFLSCYSNDEKEEGNLYCLCCVITKMYLTIFRSITTFFDIERKCKYIFYESLDTFTDYCRKHPKDLKILNALMHYDGYIVSTKVLTLKHKAEECLEKINFSIDTKVEHKCAIEEMLDISKNVQNILEVCECIIATFYPKDLKTIGDLEDDITTIIITLENYLSLFGKDK